MQLKNTDEKIGYFFSKTATIIPKPAAIKINPGDCSVSVPVLSGTAEVCVMDGEGVRVTSVAVPFETR